MGLATNTVFEVRTAGSGASDNNGGAFVKGGAGTDYSVQDSPQVAFDGTTIKMSNGGASATVTVTGATPDATWVDNHVFVTAGTNFTVGLYRILSTAAGTVTFDRAATTGAGAAGAGNMGGAFASPGRAGQFMVAGNCLYIKAGTYTVTSVTANTNAGCISLPGSTGSNTCFIEGYQTTRGDLGTKPVIIADGVITTFTFIAYTGNSPWVINLTLDGNSRTGSKGLLTNGTMAYRCIFQNFVGSAFQGNTTSWGIECEFTGNTTANPANGCNLAYCRFTNNTVTPWAAASGGVSFGCIYDNNTGASTDAISFGASSLAIGCTSYNQGRDGFRMNGPTGTIAGAMAINCLATGTNGSSIDINATAAQASFLHIMTCAADTFSTNTTSLNKRSSVTLSSDPFTAKASSDFSLNNTAGGGASARNAGTPTTFQGGGTATHEDIGAVHHADPTQPLASHTLNDQTYNDGATTGTLTLPSASHVLNDQTYGIAGNGSTGTLTQPLASHVLNDQTYGIAGNGSTGTLTLSLASHTLSDQTYGIAGNGLTGTATLPTASQVKTGISYGIGGNGLTGNVTLPGATNVASGVQYGASGTEFTGSLVSSGSGGSGTVVMMV